MQFYYFPLLANTSFTGQRKNYSTQGVYLPGVAPGAEALEAPISTTLFDTKKVAYVFPHDAHYIRVKLHQDRFSR